MKCCMVTGFMVDVYGDAGDEVYCTNEATQYQINYGKPNSNAPVCDSCAEKLENEDIFCSPTIMLNKK